MEMKLDFRPGHEVFRRWLWGMLAKHSNNVDVNLAVRLNQAMVFLLLVMALLVPMGVGELARQQHHLKAGKGTVMDGLWDKPEPQKIHKGREVKHNGK